MARKKMTPAEESEGRQIWPIPDGADPLEDDQAATSETPDRGTDDDGAPPDLSLIHISQTAL